MAANGKIYQAGFSDWQTPVDKLLRAAGLADMIRDRSMVLIKPNLVEALPPPITTPAGLVEAIVKFLRNFNRDLRIIIGEGTGSRDYDTFHPFRQLGYIRMAERLGVELVDLNEEPLRRLELAHCRRWPEMYLPEIVLDSFLLSVPVLKAHSLARVTLTMKNMMGCAPPSHYERGGYWRKAAFHKDIQAAILDLNRYRTPDFTVLDATVGMREAHLWGPPCEPPPRIIAAARDPVAIDVYGSVLLGRDWRQIGHLAGAHGELGIAEPLEVIVVD